MMERSPEKPSSPKSQPGNGMSEPSSESEKLASPVTSPSNGHEDSNAPLPEERPPPLPNEDAPPLPDEPPPLPAEAPPTNSVDDGWEPVWDDGAQAFYFYNRFSNKTQWENPRVPESVQPGPPVVGNHDRAESTEAAAGGYNPAVHGDYDPNADYAKASSTQADAPAVPGAPGSDPAAAYAATGTFNRFTGKWQNADFTTERFTDEQKSKRQMNAFFDVDAAANSHDGRSLRAERANKKLSKQELKAFKEKRREKKEEKRRAWLRD